MRHLRDILVHALRVCVFARLAGWLNRLSSAWTAGAILNLSVTASGEGSVGIALEDLGAAANQSYMPHTDLPGADYKYYGVSCGLTLSPPFLVVLLCGCGCG